MNLTQALDIQNQIETVLNSHNVDNVFISTNTVQFDVLTPPAHGEITLQTQENSDTNNYRLKFVPKVGNVVADSGEHLNSILKLSVETLQKRYAVQENDPLNWGALVNASYLKLSGLEQQLKNDEITVETPDLKQNILNDIQFIKAQNLNKGVISNLVKIFSQNYLRSLFN